ncbi:hypothetical protein [Streptomyces tendae]
MATTTRDVWGLKCTCEARNRFATWHSSACDLFQKFPADGCTADRATEK